MFMPEFEDRIEDLPKHTEPIIFEVDIPLGFAVAIIKEQYEKAVKQGYEGSILEFFSEVKEKLEECGHL